MHLVAVDAIRKHLPDSIDDKSQCDFAIWNLSDEYSRGLNRRPGLFWLSPAPTCIKQNAELSLSLSFLTFNESYNLTKFLRLFPSLRECLAQSLGYQTHPVKISYSFPIH